MKQTVQGIDWSTSAVFVAGDHDEHQSMCCIVVAVFVGADNFGATGGANVGGASDDFPRR